MMPEELEVDCTGEAGGTAQKDECGRCGGPGILIGECDCDHHVLDEYEVCGGVGNTLKVPDRLKLVKQVSPRTDVYTHPGLYVEEEEEEEEDSGVEC